MSNGSNTTQTLPFLQGLPVVNQGQMLALPQKPLTEQQLKEGAAGLLADRPGPVSRGFQAAGQFFGPFGTHTPKNVAAFAADFGKKALIAFMGDALVEQDPEKIAKLEQIIVDEGYDPAEVKLFAVDKEMLDKNNRELLAIEAGMIAAGITGLATRTVLGAATRGAVSGAAFGATEGALTPLEEGESRGERIVEGATTVGLIGFGFGAGASAARLAFRQDMVNRGIKPELEVPEVAPMTELYDPAFDARLPVVKDAPPLLRAPITDPRRLLPIRSVDPKSRTIASQEAGVSALNQAARDIARRRLDEPPAPARKVEIPPDKPLPEGAPEVLGEGVAQPPTQRRMLSDLIALGDEAGAPISALKELTRRLGEELQPAQPTAPGTALVPIEQTNMARIGLTEMITRSQLNDILGVEVGRLLKESVRVGRTTHNIREVLDRNDRLGFDGRGDAAVAIIKHADWRERWEVSDLDARVLEEWRTKAVTRLAEAEAEARDALAEQQTKGGLTVIEGGGPPTVPPSGPRGGRTGAPAVPPTPKETTYSEAIDEATKAISVGETRKRPRITVDEMYTQLFDNQHPINKATSQLLAIRDAAARKMSTSTDLVVRNNEMVVSEQPTKLLPGSGGGIEGIDLPPGVLRSQQPGERLPAILDPYILADLARSSIEQGIEAVETGPLDFKTLTPVGPGLRQIMKDATDLGLLSEVRAFLLAPKSLDWAARGLIPPIKPEVAQAIIKGAPDAVVQRAMDYFGFTDANLQYLIDAGGVSKLTAEAFRKGNRNYVDFARFFETNAETNAPGVPRAKVTGRLSFFKAQKAKGGEGLKVIDPFETALTNTMAYYTAANRHAVLEALVKLSEGAPGQTIVRRVGTFSANKSAAKIVADLTKEFKEKGIDITSDVAEEMALHLKPSIAGDGRFFLWRDIDGKPTKVVYEVDRPLFDALTQLDPLESNMLLRLMSFSTSVFRAGVILEPAFSMIRNPIRDTPTSLIYSKGGLRPIDFIRGAFEVLDKGEAFSQFRRGMGPTSITRMFNRDRKAQQKHLQQILEANHPLKEFWILGRNPANYLEMLRMLTDAWEAVPRVAEFMKVMEKTGDPRLAGFAAKNLSLNFHRMGTSIRAMNKYFSPFLAASLQGAEKIPREFKRNPAGIAANIAVYITLPTIALWLVNFDDPDYQNLPQYIKDNYWLIPKFKVTEREVAFEGGTIKVPNIEKTGDFFRLPKPFELGLLFGASVERALQAMAETDEDFKRWMESDNIPAGDPFEGYLTNLMRQMMPGNLPPWLSPLLESQSGYDFFAERNIVPESEKDLIKWLQAGPRQGETTRLLGRYLGWSPRKIDNVVSKSTGGLGRSALATADRILSAFGVEGPEEIRSPAGAIPLIGPMLETINQRAPTLNSKPVERFYNVYIEAGAIVRSVQTLHKQGKFEEAGVLTANSVPEMLYYPVLQVFHEQMRVFRESIRAIQRQDNLPLETKQERVKALGMTYRDLAAQAVIGYNRLKKELELGIPDESRQPTPEGGTFDQVVPQGF